MLPDCNLQFSAMDAAKKGSLQPSEFKTCLLALGIRATLSEVALTFKSFDGDYLLPNGAIMYRSFIRAIDERKSRARTATVPIVPIPKPPTSPSSALKAADSEDDTLFFYAQPTESGGAVASDVPLGSLPPPSNVRPAVFIPTPKYVTPEGPPLSEDVGHFEDNVNELEKSLQATIKDLENTTNALNDAKRRMTQIEQFGVVTAGDLTDEIEDKTQQIKVFGGNISKLTGTLNELVAEEKDLRLSIQEKYDVVQKNAIRRADKEQVIKQLEKATAENESQLEELENVYNELQTEIEQVDMKMNASTDHINVLLSPAKAPQSMTVKSSLTAAQREKIKERNERAAEQHRINLMRNDGGTQPSNVWGVSKFKS